MVAQNDSCPPALLRELAGNKDKLTRQAVASNPNTNKDTLLKLASEFPQEFLDNPILDLLLLENPNLLGEMPQNSLISLLKEVNVPISFFKLGSNIWR